MVSWVGWSWIREVDSWMTNKRSRGHVAMCQATETLYIIGPDWIMLYLIYN